MDKQTVLQIGIDWSDRKHDYAFCVPDSSEVEQGMVRHDPVSLHEWINLLRGRFPTGRFAVCLETSRGTLVEVLRAYDFIDLYPINPITANRFRESMFPSLSKDDPMDARLILDILLKHGERLRPSLPADPQMRLLEGLVQARRRAVEGRIQLLQRLIEVLKSYYPQALEMVGTLGEKMSLDFLRKWPNWETLAKARPSTLRGFYYGHRSRSETLIANRLKLQSESTALTRDAATIELGMIEMRALVDQIQQINRTVEEYEKRIQACYEQMDARLICDSLPGAGKVLAPRLAVAMGCHASLCDKACDLAAYSGIAPISQRSGRTHRIGKRHRLPKFLHQTFLEYAHWSTRYSAWAKAYYQHRCHVLKHGHWAILRSLAFKWIRILFRCWQTGRPYDENTYIQTLKQRGSPIANYL